MSVMVYVPNDWFVEMVFAAIRSRLGPGLWAWGRV